jgi:flavin reductase (DIM6/NTAB) family NADH-FMN oxidoreductase RutF
MTGMRRERLEVGPLESIRRAPAQSHHSGLVEPATFCAVLGHSPTGVSVVTTRDSDGCNHGITVSSYASLSLEPPLVLICIDRRSRIHRVLLAAPSYAVNILSADQELVARRFSSCADDRFAGITSYAGKSGDPLIGGALAYLECLIVDEHRGGDHSIFVGAVAYAEAREGLPLLRFRGDYTEPLAPCRILADVSTARSDIHQSTCL